MTAGPRIGQPIDDDAFVDRMRAFEPFEPAPRLAVAVSGGGDSMALAWLADRWARARGGGILALTVDHRLQPGSDNVAASVQDGLAARRIACRILVRDGPAPKRAIEAVARDDRYALLEEACRSAGIPHLLLAHHRDDQAETVLLRLAAGSGIGGLAGMAPQSWRRHVRLLRPLLDLPRDRLVATADVAGLRAFDDPMNVDDRFARPRLRQSRAVLGREGLTPYRLCALAADAAAVRADRARQLARLAAVSVTVNPNGFLLLEPEAAAVDGVSAMERLLLACLRTVAGAGYGPRRAQVAAVTQRLLQDGLSGFRGRTLGGCVLRPVRGYNSAARYLLICREPAVAAAPVPVAPGAVWDGRFTWHGPALPGHCLGATTPADNSDMGGGRPEAIPTMARATLPALIPDMGTPVSLSPGRHIETSDGPGFVLWQPAHPLITDC